MIRQWDIKGKCDGLTADPVLGFPPNYLGMLGPWTGHVRKVALSGPRLEPQGLLFLPRREGKRSLGRGKPCLHAQLSLGSPCPHGIAGDSSLRCSTKEEA